MSVEALCEVQTEWGGYQRLDRMQMQGNGILGRRIKKTVSLGLVPSIVSGNDGGCGRAELWLRLCKEGFMLP